MSKIVMTLSLIFITMSQSLAQLPDFLKAKRPAGYMGLFDWGASIGYLSESKFEPLALGNSLDTKTSGAFFKAHFTESIISNNFWRDDANTRIKFGIVEMLEFGISYPQTVVTVNAPNAPAPVESRKVKGLISYEGGLGAVYRVNDKLDIGMNFFFISASSFNDGKKGNPSFAKFRFRYSHLMAEISMFGRNQLDIKYVGAQGGITPYIGFCYTGWKTEDTRSTLGIYKDQANYVYLTFGGTF